MLLAGLSDLALATDVTGQHSTGDGDLYKIDVPAGQELLIKCDLRSSSGQTELYVKYGSEPTRSSYDLASSWNGGPDTAMIVPNTMAGSYYVLAYAVSVSGTVPYTIRADNTTLALGVVSSGTLANTNDFDLYRVDPGASQNLIVQLDGDGVSDDNELYIRRGALPNPTDPLGYDAAGKVSSKSDQYAAVMGTQAGIYYILVRCTSDDASGDGYRVMAQTLAPITLSGRIGVREQDWTDSTYTQAVAFLGQLGATIVRYDNSSLINRADVDAIFLPSPSAAFGAEQLAAIETFYHQGGAMVVLDDWGDAPSQWNASSNQLLNILGLQDAGHSTGQTPLDARVVLSHPVTAGPAGTVNTVGLDGQGYDYFVNLPSYAKSIAVDAADKPVIVAISAAAQDIGYGPALAIGDHNCVEEAGEGDRTWLDNLILWENTWSWLLSGGVETQIDSPMRSGTILAGDYLRYVGQGKVGAGQTPRWDFGDGRTSSQSDAGLLAYPTGGDREVTFGIVDQTGQPTATGDHRIIQVSL